MKCSLCGKEIDEKLSKESCSACFVSGGCSMIKCPNCGYEMPVESSLAKKVVHWFSFKRKGKKRVS